MLLSDLPAFTFSFLFPTHCKMHPIPRPFLPNMQLTWAPGLEVICRALQKALPPPLGQQGSPWPEPQLYLQAFPARLYEATLAPDITLCPVSAGGFLCPRIRDGPREASLQRSHTREALTTTGSNFVHGVKSTHLGIKKTIKFASSRELKTAEMLLLVVSDSSRN